MNLQNPPKIEDRIARCRLILSAVAMGAVFADPTEPFVSDWFPLVSGSFQIDAHVMLVMGLHLLYSVFVYIALQRVWLPLGFIVTWTPWIDVVLSAAIAFVTEGATSPFYPFFVFAAVVAGFRSGLRQAMLITAASVVLYVGMIMISAPGSLNVYIMRPAYLAIVGYLVGYLGQQRIDLQGEIQQLEAAAQRHRIARDLHDGFAQALAGINLRIEGCRRLLRRGGAEDAMSELTDLQLSVHREYDELRSFMQSLAGVPLSPASAGAPRGTRFALDVRVEGSMELVDHVLQIAREGLSNVRRHAEAESARIDVRAEGARVRISIDDDGVGLRSHSAPWSIVSRVKELGGQIQVAADERPGSHLSILLPQG
ncbi:MAG: sensor histidine kinase [Candidatus Binatia bacterium]